MDDSYLDLLAVLTVAETGSFSAAARTLGVGQATISRRVANLEARSGTALFERGRDGAAPTAAALSLLPAAREASRWISEFERVVAGQDATIEGIVRVVAPPGVAVELVAPFARHLQSALPEIRLEVIAGIEHIDLLRGGADLAIRMRAPLEPDVEALASMIVPLGAYAASSYAARLDDAPSWADLDWICWAGTHRALPPRGLLEQLIRDFEPAFASDDYLVQLEALRSGVGCMILGKPDVRRRDSDDLVELDLGVDLPPARYHLVSTRSGRLIARVQAVAEALKDWIRVGFGTGAPQALPSASVARSSARTLASECAASSSEKRSIRITARICSTHGATEASIRMPKMVSSLCATFGSKAVAASVTPIAHTATPPADFCTKFQAAK